MFYTRDAPLLMRHATSSLLARLSGRGGNMLTSGVGRTERVRHLEELGSCHSPRPAPRLWRRSRFAILTARWAGERQRAAASRRTAREAEDEACMHLGPPLMVLADGSHETHLKLAGASSSCVFNDTHTSFDSGPFEASRTYRLSKGPVDHFPLSNPAAKVGHGPAPGGTHTPDGCLSTKPVGMIRLRKSAPGHSTGDEGPYDLRLNMLPEVLAQASPWPSGLVPVVRAAGKPTCAIYVHLY
ncbi:uncharacterized protein BXZ73DRAFT_82942 [Epithele typhae]|uniref:uncharacterized protein n=1 Tax=Epithele typhae TaxID=378194 RepID=UPI0020077FDA|nr:uncharacterized protein BXZ73DRAFT_82942 [Epithele typhae]KAH9911178.1 hypothetical protein BXZ73DRAFT_82942 [Epithele typhae]